MAFTIVEDNTSDIKLLNKYLMDAILDEHRSCTVQGPSYILAR